MRIYASSGKKSNSRPAPPPPRNDGRSGSGPTAAPADLSMRHRRILSGCRRKEGPYSAIAQSGSIALGLSVMLSFDALMPMASTPRGQ